MISCDQAGVLMERRLDDVASRDEGAALDTHLATCPSCAALFAREAALDAALASHFAGAAPSRAFAAGVRRRVAAERPAVAGWIPDALNAAGLVLSVLVVVPLGAWWGGAAGAAVSLAAVAVTCYPLLLGGLAAEFGPETGSGEPDPAA